MDLRNIPINVIIFIIVAFCLRPVKTIWTNAIVKENDPYAAYGEYLKPTTRELVQKYNYPFQVHKLTTQDGYNLELHRIPHNKTTTTNTKKIPILLIHGLFEDSASFIDDGEENSPAFIFVNAGYDVWLHNSRGTRYSMEHEHLSSETDFEYWDFCFEDIGNNDLPAEVDYILSVTNAEKVYVVGFSIGGASSTIFLADNPSYNDKVASLFLLAPSICLFRETHEMVYNFLNIEKVLLVVLEELEAMPFSEILYETCEVACDGLLFKMCRDFVGYINDGNSTELDNSEVVTMLANVLSRVTVKMLRHLLQMVARDDFLMFDHGAQINQQKYGQVIPPGYQIENITAPVSIFCAVGDSFVLCEDLQRISSRFRNVSNVIVVPLNHHTEFSGGENAKLYVYDRILSQMEAQEMSSDSESSKTKTFTSIAKEVFEEYNSFVAVTLTIGLLLLLFSGLCFFLINSCRKDKRAGEQEELVANTKRYSMYN